MQNRMRFRRTGSLLLLLALTGMLLLTFWKLSQAFGTLSTMH